jgi:hypothetical protein
MYADSWLGWALGGDSRNPDGDIIGLSTSSQDINYSSPIVIVIITDDTVINKKADT